MGWVAALEGKTIGLDTAPLIYFLEENPDYLPRIQPLFAAVANGEDYYTTSPHHNPNSPITGGNRVMRDGSWSNHAAYTRTDYRRTLCTPTQATAWGSTAP